MATSTERPPADFLEDVNDPLTLEAEQRVYPYLTEERLWTCEDVRDKCLPWDFLVTAAGPILRLDVKADSYIDETGRIPFEDRHVYRDGSEAPGWGRDTGLDVVAVVGTTSWRCAFVRVEQLRTLVGDAIAQANLMPHGWRPFDRDNGNKRTKGWAIPLDQAWRAGAIWHVAELSGGGL